jgi:hypothetical protein
MFTERYMVEWLLQNSLGLTWLAMCRKRGWTADAERVLPVLDARRAAWRAKRDAGEVALDALMPIEGELEDHWKYYVPQPIPDDAVEKAPESVRAIKILDPACGSGHFLVIAFDLLVALYREEAKHLGANAKSVTDPEIAESILENNLHGIDIDPRAIQIAPAGLYLKAKSLSTTARPKRVNLVAPVLQLGNLPPEDPAVVVLRQDLKREVGIPEELTTKLLSALAGVDYLGSLLKVDAAVEGAIKTVELEFERSHGQGDLFGGFRAQQVKLSIGEAKASILDRLEQFLAKHSTSEDLGLRLDGEQLAAGVRFVRMAKEGAYDVVVGNPPYQGTSKTVAFEYVAKTYPRGKADLYAAFLERSLEFARLGGASAMVTMRGWMFLSQFTDLRRTLLSMTSVQALGDLGTGAFSSRSMDDVISTVLVIVRCSPPDDRSVAIQAGPLADPRRDAGKPARRQAALLSHVGRYDFDPRGFNVIEGEPIVYWWSKEFLSRYGRAAKLGDAAPVRQGAATSDNARFLRRPFELRDHAGHGWAPYIKGGAGRAWYEPLNDVVRWEAKGLEVRAYAQHLYGSYTRTIKNESFYFRRGVAFTPIGSGFEARVHRYAGVFGHMGSSAFPATEDGLGSLVTLMNSAVSKSVLGSLNPGVHFEVGDVNRLPVFHVESANEIFAVVERAFSEHEASRETSVEFRRPRRSPWRYAQEWAQHAVDRADGTPVPPVTLTYEEPAPAALLSFAVGVALGRFGANGEGIRDRPPATALPGAILFLSHEAADSLDQPACAALLDAWKEHGAAVGEGDDLRTYLRKSFFDYHRKLYENRPIYFPLSSTKRSFVAFVSIHRSAADTLNVLLADHLVPAKRRLDGELEDLRLARASGANKGKAEKRFAEVQKLLDELNDFLAKVTDIAEKGPPPPDDKTTKREVDARYAMDLDDGVMVNSAALWPLLEPQWKDPKKWWRELALASGKKDYDWSHLAARYFPTRVRKKCHDDPSLAVAHKCFWELHPAKAYAWELRLQDEIRPDFTIDEPLSNASRVAFLRDHAGEAREILAKELKRREKKNAKADDEGEPMLLDTEAHEAEDSDD